MSTLARVACLLVLGLGPGVYAEEATSWIPSRVVSIEYPLLARQARAHGLVLIECTLASDGHVSTAKILSGPGLLGRAVLDRIGEWRFRETAGSGGAPTVRLNFNFVLEDQDAPTPRTTFIYEFPYDFTIRTQPIPRDH